MTDGGCCWDLEKIKSRGKGSWWVLLGLRENQIEMKRVMALGGNVIG
jgi:hypothetical protein